MPIPTPGPRPAPPGSLRGDVARETTEAITRLEDIDPGDLDAVLAAAEDAHRSLRDRLGEAGAR